MSRGVDVINGVAFSDDRAAFEVGWKNESQYLPSRGGFEKLVCCMTVRVLASFSLYTSRR